MTPNNINPEEGYCCNVVFAGSSVIKTTKESFSYKDAQARLDLLEDYAAALAAEPLPVAPLTSATLTETEGKFALRFTMGLIPGPSVESLRGDERREAAGVIIGNLCAMSQIKRYREPGILRVPIDALLRNWHIDPTTKIPTLIDIYPPWSRDALGRIKYFREAEPRRWAEKVKGRLGNIVPYLVADIADKEFMSDQ
ncbi:MAG TPA: hypothetical protein VFB59_03780, partial [Candidatus Saccharimonadales bacterium]|nr:hypothetical protein [Candidatus Saccharimonadales bacterium]